MTLDIFDPSTLVLIISCILLLIVLFPRGEKYKNLPPGPRALPIVGYIFTFMRSKQLFKDLAEMSKVYGSVMKVRLGTHDIFILSGYDVIKEAMVDKAHEFSERPRWLNSIQFQSRHKSGLMFHEDWRSRRRFALVSMRDFGLGKRSLEDRMVEEAGFLTEEIAKSDGQPMNLSMVLPYTTANIICTIIIGSRFQYGDEDFLLLLTILNKMVRSTFGLTLQNFVPLCKYLPTPRFKESLRSFSFIMNRCAQWKKEHTESFDPDNLRDLVDLFLAEQQKDPTQFDDTDLLVTITELFVAGTETTSTTLSWALLYLLHYPEVQDKCRREIHKVIGAHRPPVYADIKKAPYVNAVMNEVQRLGNIVPLSLWHSTSANAKLAGYTIPKDCIVMMNLDTALKDPKYWTEPEAFKPERWLDVDGKVIKNLAFIPFSVGKRVCLGEQLAKKEYYIFLASMLQKFIFKMENEGMPPSLEGLAGVIHAPRSYKLRAIKV